MLLQLVIFTTLLTAFSDFPGSLYTENGKCGVHIAVVESENAGLFVSVSISRFCFCIIKLSALRQCFEM